MLDHDRAGAAPFPKHVDEAARRQFEASLAANEPRPLISYLPDANDPKYVATLEELVAIAIEYSWKQWARGQESPFPLSLEGYLSQFSALKQADILARLVQHADDVRRQATESQLQTVSIPPVETTSSVSPTKSSSQPASTNPEVIASRLGQYQLFERIGRGGMGVVHRAVHTRLQKQVAIKILSGGRWSDASLVQRFEREMRATGQLHHPNVVITHDAGEIDGLHYLVMELVEGEDLETILTSKQTLSEANACRIIHDVAQTLQHAHSKHLVHRDIKPSNIMLTRGGDVKLLDLGLALLTVCVSESGDITQPNQCMGTLLYMAPEQAEDSHLVGTPADIYSLGATLYRLLSGESPHGPRNLSPLRVLAGLQRGEFTPLETLVPNCRSEVSRLVGQMLSRNPADRPKSATVVAEALAPFAVGADLAKLMRTSADVEEVMPEVPPPQELHNTDKRLDSRLDWWRVCFSSALIVTVLVAAVAVRQWDQSGKPPNSEADPTADQLTLQAWPLLPQAQVIDWIRGQGGDAIV
jgi:serine/threonine protein kinase